MTYPDSRVPTFSALRTNKVSNKYTPWVGIFPMPYCWMRDQALCRRYKVSLLRSLSTQVAPRYSTNSTISLYKRPTSGTVNDTFRTCFVCGVVASVTLEERASEPRAQSGPPSLPSAVPLLPATRYPSRQCTAVPWVSEPLLQYLVRTVSCY